MTDPTDVTRPTGATSPTEATKGTEATGLTGATGATGAAAHLERLTWFARSSVAPPLTIALACVFIVVNEIGYQTVSAVTRGRDEGVRSRIAIEQLRGTVVAAESAQRGLMLTARPVYRETFEQSLLDVALAITDVQRAVQSRPHEAQALREVVDLAQRKVSELQETMKRLNAGNLEGARELMLSDIGREQMADIDRSVEQLSLVQGQALRESAELRNRVLLYSRVSILGLVLLCLAAVLTTMRVLRHRDAERLNYLNALRAERDKLEATVSSRTGELSDLARHLQTVREDERSHLARELHDELGSLLTAAKLDLARMRSRLLQAGPEVSERVAHLHATLDAGIALKRRIIEDLRPSSLENLGLGPALRILCQEWSRASDIAVKVEVQAEVEEIAMPPERSLAIYRLVQEALTNIAKYAQSSAVSVALAIEGTGAGDSANCAYSADDAGNPGEARSTYAVVVVRDNGRGFEVGQPTPGHGLAGMRFRVASIGGELTVESAPGQGTTIRARLPLQD